MGRYKPGQSGNPAGRPKGTPNKLTQSAASVIEDAINGNYPKFLAELEKLKGHAFVNSYLKLLQLVMPRTADLNILQSDPIREYLSITDPEERARYIMELKNGSNGN